MDRLESARVFATYTCPVSRITYSGHPRNGTLYEHNNDLHEAIHIIHNLAHKHGQPVSWVINDQEYTNCEGLLPHLRKWREEGDSILVTMELTTSPAGVDKYDTCQVIRWIDDRCKEAGLPIDGLWSLKFLESDLEALASLPHEEFPWTRNLAGSCWHQYGIDDSTWGGCPYNPYYVARWNSKAPAAPNEPTGFLMTEWLSRDITAILAGGFPATFSLDPADPMRADMGGYDNEPDALRYSEALVDELAQQGELNPLVVININEEARHWQTEGHDKAYLLDGIFARIGMHGEKVCRLGLRELWPLLRRRLSPAAERLFVTRSCDFRKEDDLSLLYEDTSVQMGFLRSRGSLPVELIDYAERVPGSDSNDPYPLSELPNARVIESRVEKSPKGHMHVSVAVESMKSARDFGVVLWDAAAPKDAKVNGCSSNVKAVRIGLNGEIFLRVELAEGASRFSVELQLPG